MADEPLATVTLQVCQVCLLGQGGECHTPGCTFWMCAAPDVPLGLTFPSANLGDSRPSGGQGPPAWSTQVYPGQPPPPPRKIAKGKLRVNEADWSRTVHDAAEWLGWARYHPWLSVKSPRGWPDEALCRPPRLLLVELKAEDGKYTAGQEPWLTRLAACPGVEVYVWRPEDYDEVIAILR